MLLGVVQEVLERKVEKVGLVEVEGVVVVEGWARTRREFGTAAVVVPTAVAVAAVVGVGTGCPGVEGTPGLVAC